MVFARPRTEGDRVVVECTFAESRVAQGRPCDEVAGLPDAEFGAGGNKVGGFPAGHAAKHLQVSPCLEAGVLCGGGV